MDDFMATMRWIDCWCPDAAQFILVEAPADLRSDTCQSLIRVIGESHLRPKIRLVCSSPILADAALLAVLHREEIGFLALTGNQIELEALAEKGILGVRVDAKIALSADASAPGRDARHLVSRAHDLGLRSIASQVPRSADVGQLLALGFDYVSQSDKGFVPTRPTLVWRGRVV